MDEEVHFFWIKLYVYTPEAGLWFNFHDER